MQINAHTFTHHTQTNAHNLRFQTYKYDYVFNIFQNFVKREHMLKHQCTTHVQSVVGYYVRHANTTNTHCLGNRQILKTIDGPPSNVNFMQQSANLSRASSVRDYVPISSSQPASQPVNQPASQPTSQPANQPASQPASQPANQPSSQPGS
jgi:hypothetical protein